MRNGLYSKQIYKRYIKRVLDLLFSLVFLPLFLLIVIIVAPTIVINDRGPVFYNAPRLGLNGRVFKMFKFRSMKVNSPDLRNADGTTYNSEDDPRVTKVGRYLRRASIDETPQILNVLIGNMSFIGPRPEIPGKIEKIYRPGDEKKLSVKPGITGYSQAYYRNSSTLEQRFDGDLYYAENVSFVLDLQILFKTVKTVFARENVYRN